MSGKILVTGASGKLGSVVIDSLIQKYQVDVSNIIALSSNPDRLAARKEQGIEVRKGDFNDPESLEKAFSGVERVLIVSVAEVGERIRLHGNAVKAAKKAGVSRVVYTSMPNADKSPITFADEHNSTEKLIQELGFNETIILRNNWYFENLIELSASILQTKVQLSSSSDGKVSQISRDDLAVAAAAALVKSELSGVFTLGGQQSLTDKQFVKALEEVTGVKVNLVSLSSSEHKAKLVGFGLPEAVAEMVVSFDTHNSQGLSDFSSKDFESLTGEKPTSFSDWLSANKEKIEAIAESKGS